MNVRHEAAKHEEQAATNAAVQDKRQPGRPRKGGKEASLRKGLEISLAETTLVLLAARTSNRSAYIERLILGDEDACDTEHLKLLKSKLSERMQWLPQRVIERLQEIEEKWGVRAAYEASEAVILCVDLHRIIYS